MRVLKAEINFSKGRTQLKYDLRPADWGHKLERNKRGKRRSYLAAAWLAGPGVCSLAPGPWQQRLVAAEGRKLGLWSPAPSPGQDQSGGTLSTKY